MGPLSGHDGQQVVIGVTTVLTKMTIRVVRY
jgi:hypothetical protein